MWMELAAAWACVADGERPITRAAHVTQSEACVQVGNDKVQCKRRRTLLSSFVNDSVASMNFLFLS